MSLIETQVQGCKPTLALFLQAVAITVLALAADLCAGGGTLGIGGVFETMNPHLIPPAAREAMQ